MGGCAVSRVFGTLITRPFPAHDWPAAQVGVELVYNAVQALLYTLIVFYMVGFDMNGSSTGAAH